VNQNSVNIYPRTVSQFGKQFPHNRDSKYTDKAERKINKQPTQPFSIHSTAAAELTVREKERGGGERKGYRNKATRCTKIFFFNLNKIDFVVSNFLK
jgi:hypothetical protein